LHIKEGDFEVSLESKEPQVAQEPAHVAHVAAQSHPTPPPPPHQEQGKYIPSPMVGTFIAQHLPNASFCEDRRSSYRRYDVCIIEAMKVHKRSESRGTRKDCRNLIDNSHPVEFGTKLFRVV